MLQELTLPLSINVMVRTPQPSRHLATPQPKVPEPIRRQRVLASNSTSKAGSNRHRMSFKFRSTEDSANLGKKKGEGEKHSGI